ncbi:MAG: heme-binding protein, partial [Chloroflexota bacterium]|nr:heme-binding protein [Chloroflexota bacterium]
MEDILRELLQEEQDLQFTKFNEATAWQIGSQLVERSARDNLPVTIDIARGDHQLFHASLRGTSPDNDEWVKRKVRLVN